MFVLNVIVGIFRLDVIKALKNFQHDWEKNGSSSQLLFTL